MIKVFFILMGISRNYFGDSYPSIDLSIQKVEKPISSITGDPTIGSYSPRHSFCSCFCFFPFLALLGWVS